MKVIEFSRQGKVSPHVVRFYVRKGLLSPERHPHNGYRIFGRDHLERIGLIRSLQALGFTLDEINKAIQEEAAGRSPLDWMREVLVRRIDETERELDALEARRARMDTALARLNSEGPRTSSAASRLNDLVISSNDA